MAMNKDSAGTTDGGGPASTDNDYSEVPVLDARGLRCPLPLLKAKQLLAQVEPGECIRVLATDAGSVRDFHAYAKLAGHDLCRFQEYDGIYDYLLRRGSYV